MLLRQSTRAKFILHTKRWQTFKRLASSQSLNVALKQGESESSLNFKSYDTILQEMQSRSSQWDVSVGRIGTNFLNRPCMVDELYKPLDLGDLVLLNLDPVVIIGTPDVPDGPYIVADAVGRAKEVFRQMIDVRLMSFVNPQRIKQLEGHLFTLDSAATDTALELGVEPSVSSSAPTSKVVSQFIHKLLARPLRQFYNTTMRRAQKLLPKVVSTLKQHQKDQATTMSFVDLVLEVCPTAASTYSVADFYAIRLCLDHYTLVHKCLLDFSYTGKYALTVLPEAAEKRNLEVIYGNKKSQDFLTDYACDNVPSDEGESRAIELLRQKYPETDRIDPVSASELLQLPLGGVSQKLRYSWFTAARNGFEAQKTHDQTADLREEFDLPVYCIDSADALEIDDGISIQTLDSNKFKLGVHIANPSAFTKSEVLVKQMLKMPTTVYELNGKAIPMLPRSLTQDLGLISGQRRQALTLHVDLDLDTMKFTNVKLTPLMLNRIVNITPEQVNESRDEFSQFSKVAQALRSHRMANGAFELQYGENQSFASLIVSEFMVMANHLVAAYCNEHNIPLLYRGQRVHTQSEQLHKDYTSALRQNNGRLGFLWRPVTQKSLVSVTPEPHTGIGYDLTTRFTSPLRRLEDYITHCQIEAHLKGLDTPFTKSDLARMVPWLQVSQELVKEYQRQLVLYDTLPKLKLGERLDGIVSQVPWDTSSGSTASKTRIYLPKYAVEAEYVGSAELAIDETHNVIIESVSVHGGSASVLLAGEAQRQ